MFDWNDLRYLLAIAREGSTLAAAKALGVGALKMAHAFDRHFVKPEQEAKARRNGKQAPRKTFTIGDV